MPEYNLTEWLIRAETKALLAYLRHRRTSTVQSFLAGEPPDPVRQGKAAAHYEIEQLLSQPAEKIREVFDNALKEIK